MRLSRLWSRQRNERLVFAGVLLLLVYAPIPLGSNRPYAWYALELAVFGLLAICLCGALMRTREVTVPRSIALIYLLLGAWLAAICLQSLTLPGNVVAFLNPFAYSVQEDMALLSVNADNSLSIDPATSFGELLKYAAYLAVFYMVLSTVTTRARLACIVGVIIAAGIAEAVFGLYSHITDFVIFPETERGNELRAGTFVNRNHYSNFLSMILGITMGLLTWLVNSRSRDPKAGADAHNDFSMALMLVLMCAGLVMLSAILTSGSRSPFVFFGLSMMIMLIVARSSKQPARGESLLAPVVVVGVVAIVLFLGFDESAIRLVDRNLLGGERMIQNFEGLKVLWAAWAVGVGAGNYRWALTLFRDEDLRFVTYDHAHNDYLQSAIEQGIPVSLLLGVAVFLMVREIWRGYRYRRNPFYRAVMFGCLLSIVYMLLHALVEFNFRIPANAVYFFAIAAVGIAARRIDRGGRRRVNQKNDSGELVNE